MFLCISSKDWSGFCVAISLHFKQRCVGLRFCQQCLVLYFEVECSPKYTMHFLIALCSHRSFSLLFLKLCWHFLYTQAS